VSETVAIVNQKGGTGKTTSAVSLAYVLGKKRRVLLIDFDPQANATSALGVDPYDLERTIYHVVCRKVPIKEIILELDEKNVSLAPSSIDLAGAEVELINRIEREKVLRKALRNVRDEYDYILIDTPPSLGLLTLNALVAADSILIPVQAEYLPLVGLDQLMNVLRLLEEEMDHRPEIKGIFLTMVDKRLKLAKDVREVLKKAFKNKLLKTEIPRSVRVAEAPSHGKTILEYLPGSPAAKAYEKLAKEVFGV